MGRVNSISRKSLLCGGGTANCSECARRTCRSEGMVQEPAQLLQALSEANCCGALQGLARSYKQVTVPETKGTQTP